MTATTSPKYVIACPNECSFHPSKIGEGAAQLLLVIKESGVGRTVFARRAETVLGHPVPTSNVGRHLLHYKVVEDGAPDFELPPGKKVGDLEILDGIIAAGYRNSRNWKPSIKDTLDAMKLKVQMTGNSAFDDLIALIDSADDDYEATDAVLSPEERPDEGDEELEELPEPLL